MKKTRILGLFLLFVMLISICAPSLGVFAKYLDEYKHEHEDGVIDYVSLGDSMTNGIGMPGYDNTDNPNTGNDGNNGFLEVAPNSYPAKFAAWLSGFNGKIENGQENYVGDKGQVHLTQLATSAMRAEDLYYILTHGTDRAITPDFWTYRELLTNSDRWGNPAANNQKDFATMDLLGHKDYVNQVANVYQDAIANADVISLATGSGNFGVFLLGRILNLIGFGDAEEIALDNKYYGHYTLENALALLGSDESLESLVMASYENAMASVGDMGLPVELVERVANLVAYTAASYLVYTIKTIDLIVEMNPDATIIIIPIINNAQGFTLAVDGTTVDMGDFLAMLYNPLNDLLAVYPTVQQYKGNYKNATFLYAELPTVDGEQVKVETFAEAFTELNAPIVDTNEDGVITNDEYPESRLFCHSRFYYDIQSFIMPVILGGNVSNYVGRFNHNDIQAYEIAMANGTAVFANHVISIGAEKAQLIAYYLGIVDAIIASMTSTSSIDSSEITLPEGEEFSIFALIGPAIGGLAVELPKQVEENAAAIAESMYVELVGAHILPVLQPYLATLTPVFRLDVNASDLDKTLAMIQYALANDPRFQLNAELQYMQGALVDGHNQIASGVPSLAMLTVLPDSLSEGLCSVGLLDALLALYGRLKLASGLSAHPSPKGHETLAQSMIACYKNNYTVKDETIKLVVNFVEENYDEINELIYQIKDQHINIDLSMEECNELISYIHNMIIEVEANVFVEESDKFVELCNNIIEILDQIRHKNEDHSFTNYIYNNDATCTANGTETAVCDFCDVTDTRESNNTAKGHNFINYIYNGDGVCTENGTMTAKCSECDEMNTIVAENTATGHSFTNYTYNNNATCTQNGTQTAKCDNCDVTDTKEVANTKLEHSFTSYSYNHNATCTENGTMSSKCDACDETVTIELENTAKGHNFKDGRCIDCDEIDPDYSEPSDTNVNQNFFVKIWTWIVNFFRSLFGFGIKQ